MMPAGPLQGRGCADGGVREVLNRGVMITDIYFKMMCLLAAVRVDYGGGAGREVEETQSQVTAVIQARDDGLDPRWLQGEK